MKAKLSNTESVYTVNRTNAIMDMATKRNHYDLKEIEEFLRTKTYPKGESQEKESTPILEEHQKDSVWKMASYFKRRKVDLLFRIRIDNEILYTTFTKGQVIPLILKQCHRILGETRRTEKILLDFFGTEYTMTLQITFKSAMDAKHREVSLLM